MMGYSSDTQCTRRHLDPAGQMKEGPGALTGPEKGKQRCGQMDVGGPNHSVQGEVTPVLLAPVLQQSG